MSGAGPAGSQVEAASARLPLATWDQVFCSQLAFDTNRYGYLQNEVPRHGITL